MNKSDLIESMATNAGISKAAAGKALDAMMKSITGELMTGGRVSLVGFGSFSVSTRVVYLGLSWPTLRCTSARGSRTP